jgi:hypothetical protein
MPFGRDLDCISILLDGFSDEFGVANADKCTVVDGDVIAFISARILHNVGFDKAAGCILVSKIINALVSYIFVDRCVVASRQSAVYIASVMDLCMTRQVEHVVRVIPNPQKDIGLNIMSYFHFGSKIRVTNCENLADAMRRLGK